MINNSASINRVCFCQDCRCCVNGYQVIKGRDSSRHGDGVTDGGKAFPWESEQNQGQFPVSRRDGGSSQYIDSKSAAKVRSAISALFLGLLHTDPQTWWTNKTKQKTCAKFQLGRMSGRRKVKVTHSVDYIFRQGSVLWDRPKRLGPPKCHQNKSVMYSLTHGVDSHPTTPNDHSIAANNREQFENIPERARSIAAQAHSGSHLD